MVELVIVLALMGIIFGIAGSKLDLGKYRTSGGLTVLMTTLQGAQRLAVQRQYNVIVSFDQATSRVRSIEDADSNGLISTGDHVVWKHLGDQVIFAQPPTGLYGAVATAVVGDNLKTLDGMPSIIMRRDGSASSNAEIYIRTTRPALSDFRAIELVQSTGRVDPYRYNEAGPSNWIR